VVGENTLAAGLFFRPPRPGGVTIDGAMPKKSAPTDPILRALRERGLTYPGAHLKSPWPGHLDLAVNDKTFAYLSLEGEPFGLGVKLPRSGPQALLLPHAVPTAYGLGKSGWVSIEFPDGNIPVELVQEWIDESYRAQAPKKLVKQLEAAGLGAPAAPIAAKKSPAKNKTKTKTKTASRSATARRR
jgi:predicted DNA-binding protein (MmcQ/YjbR family)